MRRSMTIRAIAAPQLPGYDDTRRLQDLLSAEEIAMVQSCEPGWRLPRYCSGRIARQEAADELTIQSIRREIK